MGKHAGGRPTKWDDNILEQTRKYFDEYEPYFECPVETQDKNGNVTTRMERKANPPPSIMRLAYYLNIARSTLYDWMETDNEFSDIVKVKLQRLYAEVLQENALMGEYSQPFAIFAAKNRLKWTDRQEIAGADGQPLFPTHIIVRNSNGDVETEIEPAKR